MRQRGTSLLEMLVAVAILVLIATAAWGISQGSRRFGMRAATQQFDAAVAYAQALAATSGNGATMVFDRRLSPEGSTLPGFVLTVYSGRPTAAGALQRASMAPMQSTGDVREAALGTVPFTLFLNSAAHAGGAAGAVNASTVITSDPGCPRGETAIVLTFSDPRSSATRRIPCNAAVAGTPVAVGTIPP